MGEDSPKKQNDELGSLEAIEKFLSQAGTPTRQISRSPLSAIPRLFCLSCSLLAFEFHVHSVFPALSTRLLSLRIGTVVLLTACPLAAPHEVGVPRIPSSLRIKEIEWTPFEPGKQGDQSVNACCSSIADVAHGADS